MYELDFDNVKRTIESDGIRIRGFISNSGICIIQNQERQIDKLTDEQKKHYEQYGYVKLDDEFENLTLFHKILKKIFYGKHLQ